MTHLMEPNPFIPAGAVRSAMHSIVPPNAWQTAESLGAWTLVGCTVSPGFEFSGFDLAPADWVPKPRER